MPASQALLSWLPLQERDPAAEEALRACPKCERIAQASLTAAKLPRAFGSPSPREQQLLAAAAAFRRAASAPGRLVPAVSLLNECGAERVVCTTLRPARLPHVELYDLEGVAQVGRRREGLTGCTCWLGGCRGASRRTSSKAVPAHV